MNETFKPAGFWVRFAAYLVDAASMYVMGRMFTAFGMHSDANLTAQLILVFIDGLYAATFMVSRWQATPGQRLLKIYIITAATGQKIGWRRSILRYLVFSLPSILFTMAVIAIMHPSMNGMEPDDQRQFTILEDKMNSGETLSVNENERLTYILFLGPLSKEDLSFADKAESAHIDAAIVNHEKLTSQDNDFVMKHIFTGPKFALFAFSLIYMLVIVFSIAITRYKTGLHDIICGTRALRGRPDNPLPLPD